MKIRLYFLLGISLSLIAPVTLYGAPVVSPAPLSSSALAGQIGIAAAVRGTVKISNKAQVGKIVSSGESIYLEDEISTDADSNLQILLLDETIFTIGPNSGIVIDKFIYDPSTHDGEVKAKVVKGVFRFVTGKIGQKKPQQMEVDLPSGTIGIRGTIVVGESVGGKSLVALLGPGTRNNTRHKQGSFVLSNGNNQETVNKTGFGSTIDGNGAPSKPFQVPAEQLNKMTSALGTGGGDSSDSDSQQSSGSGDSDSEAESEDSPTESAGQDTAIAGEFAMEQGDLGKFIEDLVGETSKASQESLEDELFDFDNVTTWDDLQNAPNLTGVHHYGPVTFDLYDSAFSNVIGTADMQLEIDFASGGRIGGGNSVLQGTFSGGGQSGSFVFNLPAQTPFDSGDFIAEYSKSNISNAYIGGSPCSPSVCQHAEVYVIFDNVGGDIARTATASVEITDTGGATVSLGAMDADRQAGVPSALAPPP